MSVAVAALAAELLAARDDDAIAVLVLPPGALAGASLASTIGAARVFAHTTWAASDTDPVVPEALHVELADVDEDVTEPRTGVWPGGVLATRRRRRRLDTVYGDDPRRVGLIALCHPADTAGVLAGAATVLRRDCPDLLIDLRDLPGPARPARMAALADPLDGRTLHDIGEGLFCASAAGRRLPRPTPPRGLAATLFDDRLACAGLHPPEFDAPGGGRWTGLGYTTCFVLPRPPPGPWMLRLAVADWGNAGAGFAAVIGHAQTLPAQVSPGSLSYGPVAVAPGGEVIRIRLLLPRPVADLIRWPRRIGIRLRSAVWERAG